MFDLGTDKKNGGNPYVDNRGFKEKFKEKAIIKIITIAIIALFGFVIIPLIYKIFGGIGIAIGLVILFVIVPVIGNYMNKRDAKIAEAVQAAYKYHSEGNYTFALEIAEKYAKNNCDAANLAGIYYEEGKGCSVDQEKAFYYFSLGKNNNTESKAHYGAYLVAGQFCPQNIQEGVRFLNLAANENNLAAREYLGILQTEGTIIPQNNTEGIRNLRIAAENNFPTAQFCLGRILFTGSNGVAPDQKQGIEFIQKAAQANLPEAVDFLNQVSN